MNKEIIDRNFLPKNIKFFDGNELVCKTYQNFEEDINFWKTILYEGYQLCTGNTVALYDKTIRYSYCTLVLAAAELGIRLIIIPEVPTLDSGQTDKMDAYLKVYGKIDLCILDEIALLSKPLLALTKYYGKETISKSIFNTYTIKNPDVYKLMSTTTFVEPSDILTISTTSGSTGEAKLVPYTHQQLYRNAARNTKVYKFNPIDRACHTRNMHHPFVLTDFFLPSLHIIENHYSFAVSNSVTFASPAQFNENIENFIKYIHDNKINQMAFSTRVIMEAVMEHMIANNMQFEHEFNMIVGGQYVPTKYVHYIKQTNANRMIAVLGTTETLSPLLMKTITPLDDIVKYEETFLGFPPDDTYKYHLDGYALSVSCPELYDGAITLDDRFKGSVEMGFYHLGRENFYRIDHIEFKLADVINIVKEEFNGDFDICIDTHYQNLYLAIWNGEINFEELNNAMVNKLEIKFKDFNYLDKNNYSTGFKLDQSSLRTYFREKNK